MMFSKEIYEKTRIGVIHLLIADDSLPNEDIMTLRCFAESNNPRGVLDFAKELKQEGNVLFKKEMVDEALDKYGYAGLVATCYVFGEEHRDEFFDLITSILLNFSACFIKKNVFDYIGVICTAILEFNPNQTKTLFRRATAAMEFGRKDLALWDLMLASKVDPSNKEIQDKLDQINCIASKKQQVKHDHDTPIGLRLGIPSMKKKIRDKATNLVDMKEPFMEVSGVKRVQSSNEVNVSDGEMSVDGERSVEDSKDVVMESCQKSACSEMDRVSKPLILSVNEGGHEKEAKNVHGVMVEDDLQDSTVGNSNMAESEHRFFNRRKAGSFLSSRGKKYQKLRDGKSLHFVNQASGSYMTIRLVSTPMVHCHNDVKMKANPKMKEKDGVAISSPTNIVQEKDMDVQTNKKGSTSKREDMDIDKVLDPFDASYTAHQHCPSPMVEESFPKEREVKFESALPSSSMLEDSITDRKAKGEKELQEIGCPFNKEA